MRGTGQLHLALAQLLDHARLGDRVGVALIEFCADRRCLLELRGSQRRLGAIARRDEWG